MVAPRGNIVWSAKGQKLGFSLDGKFDDPRKQPYGPLPREMGHYKGLYRHGRDVILNYIVGDCDVLDKPGSEVIDGKIVFRRELELGPATKEISIVLAERSGSDDPKLAVSVYGSSCQATVDEEKDGDRVVMKVAPHDQMERVSTFVYEAEANLQIPKPIFDLREECHGGPANW